MSAWEILEGHKNPAPLSLAWFGAIRQERKVLNYEEHFRYVTGRSSLFINIIMLNNISK